MTVTSYTGSRAARGADRFVSMRRDLDALQRQLATGVRSQTYGGLGFGRQTSLDARGRLSAIEGYDAAIRDASLRLKVMTQGLEQLAAAARDTRTESLPPQFKIDTEGRTSLQKNAAQRLMLAVDVLNTDVNGRRLFGGRAVDSAPVEVPDRLLNGDPNAGLAGVKRLIEERKQADLGSGTTKLGRLALTQPSPTGVDLRESAEPGTRANFGFVLRVGETSNPASITVSNLARSVGTTTLSFDASSPLPTDGSIVRVWVNRPDASQELRELTARTNPSPGSSTEFAIGPDHAATAANLQAALAGLDVAGAQAAPELGLRATISGGTAAAVRFEVQSQPRSGDVVRLTVALRDGTQKTLELVAALNPDPTSTAQFAIGATVAETAAALLGAVERAIDQTANTALSAASTMISTEDFFAGDSTPGREPRRIAAGAASLADASGFSTATAGRTLIWYKGDTAVSPRGTSPVQIDQGQSVGIGAQANEAAFRSVLAGLSALAAETFAAGETDKARYGALTERVQADLAPRAGVQSIDEIGYDLGATAGAMESARERHGAVRGVLQAAIDGVEEARPEAVAASILALQNRLEASYQTTAMLSRLSLVNFL